MKGSDNTTVDNSTMVPIILLELLEDLPQRIPPQPDLAAKPQRQEFLMQQGILQLVAWPISGNPILHEDFLCKLQTSCLHHGETRPYPTMAPHSLSGLAGVSRGIEIPFQDYRGHRKFSSRSIHRWLPVPIPEHISFSNIICP